MLNEILRKQIDENNIFHSYIFEGTESNIVNQYEEFSRKLLNTDIDVNNLIQIIEAENKNISINKIRELNKSVFEKPANFKYKIYIIKDAPLMRVEAQNAMLKTLEELPNYSIVIMTTDNRYKLLDTIISRSQIIIIQDEIEIDFSDEITEKTIYLIKKALENNYYIINKEKTLIKELSENKEKSLYIMSKIFSDTLTESPENIENIGYRKLICSLKNFLLIDLEKILLKIEEIKSLLKVNINFQLAIEDLIFEIIEINKKRKK